MSSCQDAVVYVSEYLHRIGSITLVVQLEKGYRATLIRFPSEPSRHLEFVFSHEDDNGRELSRNIKLPVSFGAQLSGTERRLGEMNASQSIQLSIRAAPAPVAKAEPDKLSFLHDSQIPTPWPSSYLTSFQSSESQFCCQQCDSAILSCSGISAWKALPSETWAEMMDFWHCHKPAEPEGKVASFNSSYSISAFHAYPSTALVGLSYIFFHPSQFISTKAYDVKENTSGAKYPVVCCAKCSTWLGYMEFADTFKIYKWNLRLKSRVEVPLNYPGYYYVSSTIEELIASHGVYSFSLSLEDYSTEHQALQTKDAEIALIWVFNPDFQYCTNSTTGEVDRGLKVFYSVDTCVIPSLKQKRGDVEQLFFPQKIINDLLQHLDKNSNLYPKESQNIGQDWKVSLLNRL